MLPRFILFGFILMFTTSYLSINFHSPILGPNYFSSEIVSKDSNVANIGETMGIRARFGFMDHQLKVHNVKVKWIPINGRIKGTIEMNYSFYYLFDEKFYGIMGTGFSVYLKGKKIGGDKIFTMGKERKTYRGNLSVNVSLNSSNDHIVLYARTWFICFPPNILALSYHNLTTHGLIDWLTLGTVDNKFIRIDIEISDTYTL